MSLNSGEKSYLDKLLKLIFDPNTSDALRDQARGEIEAIKKGAERRAEEAAAAEGTETFVRNEDGSLTITWPLQNPNNHQQVQRKNKPSPNIILKSIAPGHKLSLLLHQNNALRAHLAPLLETRS